MLEALKLRSLRLKEQKNFNENNLCLYEHITSYIKATNLTSYEKEEILHQIMDMLLQAQYENRDKSFVVGEDYKEFCKSIINEYTNSKSKLYIFLDYLQRYIFWLGLTVFAHLLNNKLGINNTLSISLSQLLLSNIIAINLTFISKLITRESVLVPISGKSKLSSKFKYNINQSVGLNLLCGVFLVTLISQLILDKVFNIDPYMYFINLNDVILIIIPIIILVLLGIAVYKKNYNLKY